MPLSDFMEDGEESNNQEQEREGSENTKAEENKIVNKEEADGEEEFNSVDNFLVEYNDGGEYTGRTYHYKELDGVNLGPESEYWEDEWVDLTDEFVRWEKKVNGKRCRMKRVDCPCGKHFSRGAGKKVFRCYECKRVIVDLDAPDGSFIHNGEARHNVREIWDEYDRRGEPIQLPETIQDEHVHDSRESEAGTGVQDDEEKEPQTGLDQFIGGA